MSLFEYRTWSHTHISRFTLTFIVYFMGERISYITLSNKEEENLELGTKINKEGTCPFFDGVVMGMNELLTCF